jgi:hypothetical protein
VVSFWQQRALEGGPGACYDAAVLEISTDGGLTWADAGSRLEGSLPYNGIGAPGSALAGRAAWCGTASGRASLDLSAYEGQQVRLRYSVATDSSGAVPGAFALDSFSVYGCQMEPQFGLVVQTPSAQVMAPPGTQAFLAFQVTNQGNVEDQLQVMVLDSLWPTRVELPGLIRPQDTMTVRVVVDIPAQAAAGDVNELTLSVTSIHDPSIHFLVRLGVQASLHAAWMPLIQDQ